MTTLAAGDIVRGYRVVRTLGRGGLGTTFEAVSEASGASVALKRLALSSVETWKRVELFEREAAVLRRLDHPGIPRYVEHFTVDGSDGPTLYIVQELVAGASLAEVVATAPLDEAEVRRIGAEVLVILAYLGQQTPPVVHRDVKPENVLRRPDGTVALVDFGAARGDLSRPHGGSTTVGTYGYMAPEQLHGVATPATDIYGLGSTLLFLLTGRSPAELPRKKLQVDLRSVRGVSPPFGAWLAKAIEPAPEDRFASAGDALAALRGLPGGGGPRVDFAAHEKKRPRPLTVALVAVLVLVVGAAATVIAMDLREAGRTTVAGRATAAEPTDLPTRWKAPSWTPALKWVRAVSAHMSAVFGVATSPSGELLASASNDGTVKVWKAATGEPVRSLLGHVGRVTAVAWSPDGSRLVSGGNDGVLVHDVATGVQRLRLDAGGSPVTSVDVSPDGKLVVASARSGKVQLWSLDTGAAVRTLTQDAAVMSVRFAPDGRLLAAGGDGPIRVWNVETGLTTHTIKGHTATVGAVAWSPDGSLLASVADDRTLRLVMLANLGSPTVLADAQNELWTAAYDARGKYLATAGKEGLVRVYDAMTLRLVATRQLFDHGVLSLAWAKDGNALMAGEASGAVQVLTVLGPSRADRVPAPPPDLPAVPRGMTPAENAYHRAMASAISYSGRREVLDDADRILDAALKTERTDEGTALLLVGKARTVLSRGYLQRYEHTPVSMAAASDLLKRALAKAPGLPEAHAQLGWMSHWANDDVRAKDEALLAEKGGPSGRSGVLLAEIALGAGDAEAAEKLALRTIPLQSRADVVGSYAVLERTYHWIGDHAAEDRAYEIETELEPTNAWLRGTHAERLIDRGDFDGAIAAAEAAIKVMDYPAAHGTLAYARSEKGAGALWGQRAVALAKSSFDDAVQASPTYAHAHYGLGACFRKLALEKHDPALLVRSNDEFEQAAKLDKDPTLANAARKENDRLAERVRAK